MPPRTLTLRARTALVAAVVLVLIGGAVHASLSHPVPASQTKATVQARAAGPVAERDGLLVGFAHNPAGALAAATTYVREGQRVFNLPAAARETALRGIAASGAADGFAAEETAQLGRLDQAAQRGSGPLTWLVSVLATRMDAYTPERARVSLWRVGVLSVEGMSSPLAEWTTVDYELVWDAGDWRIWSETQVPGPTPISDPNQVLSSPSQWRADLHRFVRFPGTDPL